MTLSTFTDSVGLTRRHWLYFALITALLLCDGMDVTIVSHTFPSLVKEWGVSVGGGITFIVTAGFVSMGIGAIVAGRLADRIGRKRVIVASGLLLSLTTAAGSLSTGLHRFRRLAARRLSGDGGGHADGNDAPGRPRAGEAP